MDLPQPTGPVIAVMEFGVKHRAEVVNGELLITLCPEGCGERGTGDVGSTSVLFFSLKLASVFLETLLDLVVGTEVSESRRNVWILEKLPTACAPIGIARRSCMAGVDMRLSMERQVTAVATENLAWPDIMRIIEYAPNVRSGARL